jgi:hypothetical protein
MAMSVGNFERVFTRDVGPTPVAVRAADARRGGAPPARAQRRRPEARRRNRRFGSVDVMRRAFVGLLGITPRRYRELAEASTAG